MSKIIDSLIGHVLGDAMGTPIEFFNRNNLQENFRLQNPQGRFENS